MSYVRAKISRFNGGETVTSHYVAGLDQNQTVGSLIPQILQYHNEDPKTVDITCIYCGEILDINKKLSDYDIDAYSILQFVIKPVFSVKDPSSSTSGAKDVVALKYDLNILVRKGQVDRLIDLISDRGWIDQAVKSLPTLGHDTVLYSVLQDPKILGVLLRDRQCVDSLVSAHPTVIPILQLGTQTILGPGKDPSNPHKSGPQAPRPTSTALHGRTLDYSVDQDLENDAWEESDSATLPSQAEATVLIPYVGVSASNPQPSETVVRRSDERPSSTIRQQNSPRVSRQRLQSAIAQAQNLITHGTEGHSSPRSHSVSMSTEEGRNVQRITPSALSQALALAANETTNSSIPPVSSNMSAEQTVPSRWSEQLAQLREMGVTDDLAAQQALDAANGDVVLAIQLLFG